MLLTHDSFAVSKSVLADFTKKTGITVKILQEGDAGEVVNKAILTKQRPLADAIFGLDNTFLTRAVSAGILAPYQSPELANVDQPYLDASTPDVTPIDHSDVCVVYDKAGLAKAHVPVPTSLADLATPTYKNMLVVENPATSSPGLAFLARDRSAVRHQLAAVLATTEEQRCAERRRLGHGVLRRLLRWIG